MFIQVVKSNNRLIYFDFKHLLALDEETGKIYLTSGAVFTLAEGEVNGIINRMCRAGKIAGLGKYAEATQNYPSTDD